MSGQNGVAESVNQPWTLRVLREGNESPHARRIRIDSIVQRLDSWVNGVTGIGTARDKTTHMLPVADVLLTPLMLEILYHSSDIAARIVSAIPDEAFKRPYKIVSKQAVKRAGLMPSRLGVGVNGDQTDPLAKKTTEQLDRARAANLDRIQSVQTDEEAQRVALLEQDLKLASVREKQHEALTWGRLFGLGAILVGANDGYLYDDPWMPFDPSSVSSVDFLTVLDKRDLIPYRWYANPMAPKFGDIALYQVQPVGVYMGTPFDPATPYNSIIMCHESRLVRFGAELTSKRERLRNQGADYSVLQKCFRALQLVDNNWQSASALLADASQAVIKIKGLMDMISQEPTLMQTRMQLVDELRSVVRALILDADGEDFDRKATPFSGIPEMLRETWARVGAAARMPVIILMGTSTKGLGDTGDSEIRWWYDTVASTQELVIGPQAEYIARMYAAARGFDPEDISIVFPPLWQLSEKDQATRNLTQAQADQIYIVNGVATAEEIAISRFPKEGYSLETKIDIESRQRIMALSIAQAEQEAANSLASARDPEPTPGEKHEQEQANPDPKPAGTVDN